MGIRQVTQTFTLFLAISQGVRELAVDTLCKRLAALVGQCKVLFEEMNDRYIEHRLAIRDATPFEIGDLALRQAAAKFQQETRLAHPGFPQDADNLPVPPLRLLQQGLEGCQFTLPSHKGRQPPLSGNVNACTAGLPAVHAICWHRRMALNRTRAERLEGEIALGQAIRRLLVNAGFRNVHISLVIQLIRYGSLEEFLPGYLAATPMAGQVAALDDATRTAMFDEITTALQPYTDDDGLAAPMECHVVTAHS
jgi:hypothetical protein